VLTICAQGKAIAAIDVIPFWWRVANASVSYGAYLEQFFWPVDLAFFYPHVRSDLPLLNVGAASIVLVGVSVVALICRRRRPYLLVGWLWYLGMLVPVIGLVQVGGQARADRFTYLPQIGLCIALVWATADICRSWPYRRRVFGVSAALALALLTSCAWRQTSFWHNGETLWTHTLACTTGNSVAHFNLGRALESSGRLDGAMVEYRRALAIKPDFVSAICNVGEVLAQKGKFDEATTQFRHALQIDLTHAPSHYNLGMLLGRKGDKAGAMAEFQRVLDLLPDHAATHFKLGKMLDDQGKSSAAIAHYRKAVENGLDTATLYNNLAWLLATSPEPSLRNAAEAVEQAERANQLSGGRQLAILDTLAAAYAEAGRFPEALATARKALELAKQEHDKVLIDALRSRIALYEAGRPFHNTKSSRTGRP
jgi:tetratricopeptide (TPR) repeat protein